MNRFLRKAMVLALTGSMALGMSMTAFTATNSESSYTNGGTVESDTTTINLIKDYVRGTDTASDSVSPAENFVFAITPYGVWNAGSSTGSSDGAAYTVANMPALAKASAGVTVNGSTTTVTITESQGQADRTDGKTEITLNDFQSVGDFWYQVKEAIAKTTGVFYGTNDSQDENIENANGAHDAVYYIHVQVVNNPVGGFFRSVTLHKTAPLANGAAPASNVDYNAWAKANYSEGVKVNDVKNTYYAGDLSITKQVTGNAGDKDKRFEVTVTFTKPAGTIITSDITYSAAGAANETAQTAKTIVNQNAADSDWMTTAGGNVKANANSTDAAYAQVKIYVKDSETVTFKNIPYGVTYKVGETKPDDDTYTNKFEFAAANDATTFNGTALGADTGRSAEAADKQNTGDFFGTDNGASGSISDASDTLTITNYKETTIDVGVILSDAPYVAMLILAGAAVLLYVRRRKTTIEE